MLRLTAVALAWIFAIGCGGNAPPEILDVTRLQNTPSEVGPYGVYATVVDDKEVKVTELRYKVDDELEQIVTMDSLGGSIYLGEIPGQSSGSRIKYFVVASDGEQDTEEIPIFPPQGEEVYFFDIIKSSDP